MKKTLLFALALTSMAAAQSKSDIQKAIQQTQETYTRFGLYGTWKENPAFAGFEVKNGKTTVYLKGKTGISKQALGTQGTSVQKTMTQMGFEPQGDANVKQVQYNLDELITAQGYVVAYAGTHPDVIGSVELVPARNRVAVTFTGTADPYIEGPALTRWLYSQGVNTMLVEPLTSKPNVTLLGGKGGGGGGSTPGSSGVGLQGKVRPVQAGVQVEFLNSLCSLGYFAYDQSYTPGFVIARHCFWDSSDLEAFKQGGEEIGRASIFERYRGIDAMFVRLTNSNYTQKIAFTNPGSSAITASYSQKGGTFFYAYLNRLLTTGRTSFSHDYRRFTHYDNIFPMWFNFLVRDSPDLTTNMYRLQGYLMCIDYRVWDMYSGDMIQPGDSGGPIFDDNQAILGIASLLMGDRTLPGDGMTTSRDGKRVHPIMCWTPEETIRDTLHVTAAIQY